MGWPNTAKNHLGCFTDDSGERLNGIQEVSGSIPLISTITERVKQKTRFYGNEFFALYAAIVTMSVPKLNCSKSILKSMCSL